jgi:hypothetical protein
MYKRIRKRGEYRTANIEYGNKSALAIGGGSFVSFSFLMVFARCGLVVHWGFGGISFSTRSMAGLHILVPVSCFCRPKKILRPFEIANEVQFFVPDLYLWLVKNENFSES